MTSFKERSRAAAAEVRQEIVAEAACALIAREGLAGASMRSIAREADATIGMLPRYFQSKNDLLVLALRTAAARSFKLAGRLVADGASMHAWIEASLPTDPERSLYWRAFVAFLGACIGNEELTETFLDLNRQYHQLLVKSLEDLQRRGLISADIDIEEAALSLNAFTDGIAFHSVIDPERYTPERLESMLEGFLRDAIGPGALKRAKVAPQG